MGRNNNLDSFLNIPAWDATRSLREQLEKSTFAVAARELQKKAEAMKVSALGLTKSAQAIQDSIAPFTAVVQNINKLYAPILEQTSKFEALYNRSMVGALQSSISAMKVIERIDLSAIQSLVDAFPKIEPLSESILKNIDFSSVVKLYDDGSIADEDIAEELDDIIEKKDFSIVESWDNIKKSKWFLAFRLLLIILTFFCSPVIDRVKDNALDAFGVNDFWKESGIYEWLDEMFGVEKDRDVVSETDAKASVDESKTGNISKQKREDLLNKIKEIRAFISAAPQDENTGNLLSYLSDLEKDVNGKKYGLVFEEHREAIDEILDTHTPVLTEEKDLFIDNGGQMNFLIEGDNLASLKLLEKTHRGKIDLIYIDPPYNTGAKDWKYDNNFVDSNDTFRHSKWLSMMCNRLKLAKTLLSANGALVCAIDENEQITTGMLLEDIFGQAYNIDCITVVHNPGGIQGANFSYCHEYAYFVYPSRSYYIQKERRESDDLTPFRDWGKENSKRSGSPNCFYPIISDGASVLSFGEIPSDDFHPSSANETHENQIWIWPIDKNGIERRWRFARDTVESIQSELTVVNIRGELNVQRKKQYYTRKTVWNDARFSANIYGTQLLSQIIDEKFPFPKSLFLVKECIEACEQKKEYTVLDFFAGSGTTGHAVMKLNAEDGGHRKFILCTNNENNICRDVTYERIKRVIDKENYAASLKYYKVDYVPISERLYYEYADELLKHVRELVELENGVNFTGNDEIAIVLTDEELADFIDNLDNAPNCRKLYMGHDLLPDENQQAAISEKDIEICIIPDYYYKDLQER